MELPNLVELQNTWYSCQDQDPTANGYCAIIEHENGMKVPFFAKDYDEYKDLWLALQFYEALFEQDYEIFDEDELEETKEILSKIDEANFTPSTYLPIFNSISINFHGSVIDWATEMANELRENMG